MCKCIGIVFFRVLAVWLWVWIPLSAASAGEFLTETFKSHYAYKVYVPDNRQPGPPMVVMLHGCWQSADRFAANSRMNALADQHGFIVLYPEQPYFLPERWPWQSFTAGCWQWFDPENQSRDSGEPARIMGIIDTVAKAYGVDAKRLYVAGISAGAAMSVTLGAVYPDRFAAIGASAGLEYGAATSLIGGLQAMRSGGPEPDSQGRAAYQAMGGYVRVVPVIVFQGAADPFVDAINAEQVIAQWAQTNDLALDGGIDDDDIDDLPDSVIKGRAQRPDGYTYTAYSYADDKHNEIMVRYMIDGMGHAWSGGVAEPSWVFLFLKDPFVDSRGPDTSTIMWSFFARHRLE